MSLILKIAAVGILHAAFRIAYPETGPSGDLYLAISLMLWIVFVGFINTSTKLLRLLSGAAGLIINLAVFALMALALAATMPQTDRTSVLEKLQSGKYPDRKTIRTGLGRFGINLDKEAARAADAVEENVEGAVKKAKDGFK